MKKIKCPVCGKETEPVLVKLTVNDPIMCACYECGNTFELTYDLYYGKTRESKKSKKSKQDNRTQGGRFEQELAQKLYEAGFWAHVIQQNKAGQPADIICCKGLYSALIDAKLRSTEGGFPLRRVEENQRYAMKRFTDRTGNACWFAVKLADGEIHMISSLFVFDMIQHDRSAISEDFIRGYTMTFDKWLDEVIERRAR